MERDFYKRHMQIAAGKMIQAGISLVEAGNDLMAKTRYVTIGVVTRWCNDADLAPFFFDHYSYADEIVVLLSEENADNTEEIAARYPNVRVIKFTYPNGFNCKYSTHMVTITAAKMTTDWIIAVDADEFIFPKNNRDVREVLQDADGNLLYANMWQMYRHRSEMDLDPSLKAVWLRRHGDPNRTEGPNARYQKPIIVRAGTGIEWGVGLHNYSPNSKIQVAKERFDGAHWIMADVELAIKRRMRGNRKFVSKEDIRNGWSCNNFDVTEEEIREECERHLDDPQLF